MECHYCKRANLPKEAMLSSRKCTDCFSLANRVYQRGYQRKQRLKQKKKQRESQQLVLNGKTYKITVDLLGDILSPYVNEKDKQKIIERVKVVVGS